MKKIFGALMIAVCIGMAMPAQAPVSYTHLRAHET